MRESRDSLREEISQNLNENLTEHEVVTETVIYNDSLKIERITDRVRTLESGSKRQDSRVVVRTEVVRDTVFIAVRDSVSSSRIQVPGDSLNPRPSTLLLTLKWIFWILVAGIVLIIVVKLGKKGIL